MRESSPAAVVFCLLRGVNIKCFSRTEGAKIPSLVRGCGGRPGGWTRPLPQPDPILLVSFRHPIQSLGMSQMLSAGPARSHIFIYHTPSSRSRGQS